MKTLEVFDPAMTYFDPALVRFAADLKWIEKYGVTVLRYNLGKNPQAFTANKAVAKEMKAGVDRLPVILVDGNVVSTGRYLSRKQLVEKLGIAVAQEEISAVETAGCSCKPWLDA